MLICRLLVQQRFPVRVLARDPESARRRLPTEVEIVRGDITRPATLPTAVAGVQHIIFTAGCRSGRPGSRRKIKLTEFDGVSNTIAAAQSAGFNGRFMYMTSSGVQSRSFWARALNVYKGNTLVWRGLAEGLVRSSGLSYTIIRAGMLLNTAGGRHAIRVAQRLVPLSPRYHIARADVAAVFVAALLHPRADRATFEIVWQHGAAPWPQALDHLESDAAPRD